MGKVTLRAPKQKRAARVKKAIPLLPRAEFEQGIEESGFDELFQCMAFNTRIPREEIEFRLAAVL